MFYMFWDMVLIHHLWSIVLQFHHNIRFSSQLVCISKSHEHLHLKAFVAGAPTAQQTWKPRIPIAMCQEEGPAIFNVFWGVAFRTLLINLVVSPLSLKSFEEAAVGYTNATNHICEDPPKQGCRCQGNCALSLGLCLFCLFLKDNYQRGDSWKSASDKTTRT